MAIPRVLLLLALAIVCLPSLAAGDLPSKFSNQGGIINTRHNMTQRQASGGPAGATMDQYRNDYQEICVYCHTPHGANGNIKLPLWNRTLKATTYTTYDQLGTSSLTQSVNQPGPASLACLSCHDGQTAVDSIINLPGSGGYSAAQISSQSNSFLSDNWTNTRGPDASVHIGLAPAPNENTGCLACHSSDAGFVLGAGATNFKSFAIGKDLRNDHPVGMALPAGNAEFKTPGAVQGSSAFFDLDSDGHMDKNEIRLYDARVECASCHDPHGVSPTGPSGTINPTFLRISNAGSAVCLTCHTK